ncbi:MAG: hypothetical protein J0H43_15875, partial [Actinobacteria bacterium]|nr:hypothetical protein [Actinomycetota bacterium]
MSTSRWGVLIGVVTGLASVAVAVAPGAEAAPSPTSTLGQFVPLPTTRVYDSGLANVGLSPTKVAIAGKGGVPLAATAVVVNTEVYSPSAAGYVRVTPAGTSPGVATQEFVAGQTISNLGTVKLAGGAVQVLVSAGRARILMDVSGYYIDEAGVTGAALFNPLPTSRVFDSGADPVTSTPVVVSLAGKDGIPANAMAVVVNTEVYSPSAAGYVRVTPASMDAQVAAQEFGRGQTVSNLVTVALNDGAIQVKLSPGVSGRVLMDVAGYYAAGGGSFVPLATTRVYDSGAGKVGTSPVPVRVTGLGGVPASATAIVANVEVSAPSAASYVRVTPLNVDNSVATQEFGRGQTVSNLVTVALNSGSFQVSLHAGTGRVLVDVAGYFVGPVTVPGATKSHYVDNLSALADSSSTGVGCTDAQTAPKFVLLQIGAQSAHAPLSLSSP